MLKIQGQKITVSQKDHIPLAFSLAGWKFQATDTIVFSVRNGTEPDSTVLLTKTVTNISESAFSILLTPTHTALDIGTYYWDLSVTQADGKHITLNFPALFVVKGVAHND
ncbi:MAG: hypothetical protein ACI3WS_01330 [Phascolarctobacterium sp.]